MGITRIWAIVFAALSSTSASAAEPVSFSTHIEPLLKKNCLGCHQPAVKQSELDLTSYAAFQTGGLKGPGFTAGKPEESLVVRYLTGEAKPAMPFGGKPLAAGS